ncbi:MULTISPECIES: BCCT family transporter [Pseudonocardia]|uniref:Choline/carnitine/betaine transport n=1 Tax=Pseudonocardia oroxyli TaxID=366584 RepID=A0A1G8AQW2_PSEOR|nr:MULTISPECIES: BCCT family transporter [Pseudonocardia]MCF7548058.1 BCCT family transporter [Pseudonocardia sp. WMMC193]SDH23348.1 choline/carnitine/betaine transport [Pseudonocardia oroxyli]
MTLKEPTTGGSGTDPEEPPAPEAVTEGAGAADRRQSTDKVVFGVAAALVVAFIVWGIVGTESLSAVASAVLGGIMSAGGWFFILTASAFVVFAIYLAASRYGKIPLGRDDEAPEFRTSSWVAMMFSAGMGIGLMFYGVAEPLAFFTSPPPGSGAVAGSPQALDAAMATTLFHWTLHPWSIYAVVGLAIAYGTFRKGRSQLISAAFAPLLGTRRTQGGLGKAIDIFAIFATLFGSAASLGLGALQIGGGLEAGGWMDNPGTGLLVAIIVVLTICFIASAVSGVAKGIQLLSNVNMVLAAVLAFFVFVVGPTVLILNLLPGAVGHYLADLASMAARTGADGPETAEWLQSWTVFYWAWWISWTPFVGMFIARISRGRTIKQFITGVILIPSIVSLIWFAIFGGAAISAQQEGNDLASASTEGQLFGLLQSYPLGSILAVIAMLLVAIFFVSGADAASVVMGTISQKGSIEPSRGIVIFWGAVMGAIAAVMLLVGGSDALSGIQNITIIMALPFVIVMVLLCVSLYKDLRSDPLIRKEDRAQEAVEQAVDYGLKEHDGEFILNVKPLVQADDTAKGTVLPGEPKQ